MNKTKILAIAPYEGIKTLMLQSAALRNDIDLTISVGDLDAGAAIASKYVDHDLDVIISRGGTAELIRQSTNLPVVDIPLSVYDIFRSIKLAENYTSKYALVGFPAITKNAHFLCDMLQCQIDIYTIHTEQGAAEILLQLLDKGCRTVLCDMITNSLAQKYGLTSILITSGSESIEAAFDLAVQIAKSNKQSKNEFLFFKKILLNHPLPSIAFDLSGNILFFSKISELALPVMATLKSHILTVKESGEKKVYFEYSGLLYVFHGMKQTFGDSECIVFYINHRKVPLSLIKNGIRYITSDQALEDFYQSFYGITHFTDHMNLLAEQYALGRQPVVILGEAGTGKEFLAKLLFAKSSLKNKPMAIIDCTRLADHSWTFLTEHNNSPLGDTNTTIYIKNIPALSEEHFNELISIIRDLNLTAKNRMIFTFRYDKNKDIPIRCRKVLDALCCLLMEIPPLRNRLQDLPNLASLYISNLNLQLAKEVVGIEPDAMRLLQTYNWSGNYDQFQRIMNELVTSSFPPYIKTADVSRLLKREMPSVTTASSALRTDCTLEEMNLELLKLVLAEENNNQSTAAKRLGISRTTLWRMLQKISE